MTPGRPRSAPRPGGSRRLVAAAMAAAAVLCAACSSRSIEITSTPPGALVTLNGVELGRTPLRTGFTHYGQYDLRLRLEGHEPLAVAPWAHAPWYEYPPIDLLLLPWPIQTRIAWHYELTPSPPPDDDAQAIRALIERARAMRP